jgi:hypothetical protein
MLHMFLHGVILDQNVIYVYNHKWRTPKLLVKLEMNLRMLNNGIIWELEARSQL